jgi:hypothetical protein
MGNVHVISTADALCGSHAFQHNFQLFVAQRCEFCWQFLASLESLDRNCPLVAAIPLKPLISTEYIKVFRCAHSQESRGLRSGDPAGKLTGPPRPTHCSQKVWFRCGLTMRRKWGGAPSSMNHMCCRWWRGTCSKCTGKSSTKKR